jgi:hypothetical protein
MDSGTGDNFRFLTLTAFIGIDSRKFWIMAPVLSSCCVETDAEPVGEKYLRPGQ